MPAMALVSKTVNLLTQRRSVRLQINALTRQGRKQLQQVLTEFFEKEQLNKAHVLAIHYAIVEIVFNAIKANLKFVAFREEIRRQLDRFKITEIEDLLQIIIEERTLREFMAERVLSEKLREQVRRIFDLEEQYRTGMGKRLTADEIEMIKSFRLRLRSIRADVKLEIIPTGDEVSIRVRNNVPMLQRDLDRIGASRLRHYELFRQGKVGDFFSYENMDMTESAGFGIAMVDQGLYKLGLNPFDHLRIEAKQRETEVTLTYPRRALAV
jgi:hypothetical protein